MEIAGVVIGTAGLAGLYSACMECIDRVESYQNYGTDTRHLSAQLSTNKVILQNWANRVGISPLGLLDQHDKRLDDFDTARAVCDVLCTIRDVLESNEVSPRIARRRTGEQSLTSLSHPLTPTIPNDPLSLARKRDKLAWTLHGKSKFVAQVDRFMGCLEQLHMLLPVLGNTTSQLNDLFQSLNMKGKHMIQGASK